MQGWLPESLVDPLLALGIGLLIGLEREHREPSDGAPAGSRHALGVRTLSLLALLGWLCNLLGADAPWVPGAALLVVGALLAIGHAKGDATSGQGLTTEVAALVTFADGLLVSRHRFLAVTVGVGTTVLLISKPWVRSLVPRLRRTDLLAALQLLLALAIVVPLLPVEARDPWKVLSPRRIGLFVSLIAAIDTVGYGLTRVFGQRRGTGLTGLLGGLVSSTAVTAAMAQEARRTASMVGPAQLATMLANSVMAFRVLVLAFVVSPPLGTAAAIPLLAMGLPMVAGAVWSWRRVHGAGGPGEGEGYELELKNPIALVPALKWGAFFSAVLLVSAWARVLLGDRGVLAAAAFSGLADVDAITLAASRMVAGGELAAPVGALALVIAAGTNTLVKGGIALVSGGRRFGGPVAAAFAISLAAGVGTAVWMWQ